MNTGRSLSLWGCTACEAVLVNHILVWCECVNSHLVIVPALLLPYPLVNDLLANHIFSSLREKSGYLLRAVLSVDNQAVDIRFISSVNFI